MRGCRSEHWVAGPQIAVLRKTQPVQQLALAQISHMGFLCPHGAQSLAGACLSSKGAQLQSWGRCWRHHRWMHSASQCPCGRLCLAGRDGYLVLHGCCGKRAWEIWIALCNPWKAELSRRKVNKSKGKQASSTWVKKVSNWLITFNNCIK